MDATEAFSEYAKSANPLTAQIMMVPQTIWTAACAWQREQDATIAKTRYLTRTGRPYNCKHCGEVIAEEILHAEAIRTQGAQE